MHNEVAVHNEVAAVEARPKEAEVEELAAAGSSAVAVREVGGADSVADSHPGRRRGTYNAAMPARRRLVAVPAGLALGLVPGREAQDEQVLALVAQVGQVLGRAVWDDQKSVQMAQEDRVQVLLVQDGQVSEPESQVNRALARAAQRDRVSVPESQVGQVLARAVWDDQKSVQKAQ